MESYEDWSDVTEAVKENLARSGDYLEFGVYRGHSMAAMIKALDEEYGATPGSGWDGHVYGFDSFQGLPETDEGCWSTGMYACPWTETALYLTSQGICATRYTLVEGWYKDTLTPKMWETLGIERISVVLMDCDLSASAILAFDFIGPHLQDGTIIVTDEGEEHVLKEHPLPNGAFLRPVWRNGNRRMFEVEMGGET